MSSVKPGTKIFLMMLSYFIMTTMAVSETVTPENKEAFIEAFQAKSRGLKIEALETPTPEPQAPLHILLNVNFEFGKYRLTDQSKYLLLELSEAINAPEMANQTFIISGHTDSVGSEAYNLRLSEKRATTVRNYLINTLNIEATRVATKAFGETDLLDPYNPKSSVNRRVEIEPVTN